MYFDRRCKITFICHGATIYSEENILSDIENYPPISELGIEEMENMTKYLKARGVKNDAIYTSPSVRTVQSAMMISKMFKKDYEIIEELKPRKYGKWSGLSIEQIFEKYQKELDVMQYKPEISPIDGAESSVEFIKRVKKVIDKTIEENIGNRIIIVTHPEVIAAAICGALDLPAEHLLKIYIKTGSATQISYYQDWASLVYSDYTPLG